MKAGNEVYFEEASWGILILTHIADEELAVQRKTNKTAKSRQFSRIEYWNVH